MNKSTQIQSYKAANVIDVSRDVNYENRQVSGYLCKFNTLDSDYDIIRKGAFTKSISERGPKTSSNRQIKYLLQHNPLSPAGVFVDLFEDEIGLGYVGYIEKTAPGDVILERIKLGFYKEHSIGFYYVSGKCQWIEEANAKINNPMGLQLNDSGDTSTIFECKELNLFEGSIVTWGAQSQTEFISFKSEGEKTAILEEYQKQYDFLLKNAKSYDEELLIKQIQSREVSLLNQIAVKANTIKSEKPKDSIDYNFLITNL